MFNIVLVEPEIPPNTGNVGRLCLATKSTLHLVKPLGFSLDDRQLKRAGLDYWEEVDLKLWDSLPALMKSKDQKKRCFFVTTKAPGAYWEVRFQPGDFLVFGRETKGLPESLLQENEGSCITIPMHGTRSLNLATAVAIILFEAVRQLQHSGKDGVE
ncbi:MAG TPA: tRNA (cytidine(34)-2'-O)-methyltransferase [Chthoniobacterales bacterium]|nr:tRNA (cytidine(34)-2'-O)-methyltransferase [Chthoniobacterales bacterium]